MQGDLPLAFYNTADNQFYPVLASSWTEDLANQTLIVHLRKGLYWYNGSATLPFTAWDVFTNFYIGTKVFQWHYPAINYTGVRILDNYTIAFVFKDAMVTTAPYILSTPISTPYPLWKSILMKILSFNSEEAELDSSNITQIVVPPWVIGPYYVEKVSPPYVIYALEPATLLSEWAAVFPYHTWQYYQPTIELYWTGGNIQSMNAMIAGQDSVDWDGLSPSQLSVLSSHDISYHLTVAPYINGILINQTHYPWNIAQVRQAISYAINRTEAVDAWGGIYWPLATDTPLVTGVPIPSWLRPFAVNFTYDPAKAASMLQSLGFYKKNGDWYTPNGTELTLSVDSTAGWTDTDTIVADVANQLTAFGIPTKEYEVPFGTMWGTIIPSGDYQAASAEFTLQGWKWDSVWTMGNPFADFPTWNRTAVYKFYYPNSTVGYMNMSRWTAVFESSVPGSAAYNSSLIQYTAFVNYWLPTIPIWEMRLPMEYNSQVFNLSWAWNLPSPARKPFDTGAYQIWGTSFRGMAQQYVLFGVTPSGIESPLYEAIKTDSLAPSVARYLGLSPAYTVDYRPAPSSASISLSTSSVAVGAPVTVTARLLFANGTGSPGVELTFYANQTPIGSAETDAEGIATVTFKPKAPGVYSISFSAAGIPELTPGSQTLAVASAPSSTGWQLPAVAIVLVLIAIGGALLFLRRTRSQGQAKTT